MCSTMVVVMGDDATYGTDDAAGSPGSTSDLAHEVGTLMMEIIRRVQSHVDDQCRRLDLTRQQAYVLGMLDEPVPMGALAARLKCDASNVTGIADRLEARGLVIRQDDPSDRRVTLLAATPAGRHLERAMRADIWSASPLVAGLDVEQQRRLRGLLKAALTPVDAATADDQPGE